MKNVLIASFDMEVGGVERSLISMLNQFDYERYKVDLMLYSHTGDFMKYLPDGPSLLQESQIYKTFRMPIYATIKSGHLIIGLCRLLARFQASRKKSNDGIKQMQYMWEYTTPFLPIVEKEYDVAISFLWPHYYVAKKVKAKKKIAWIHTDYSVIETDVELDIKIWNEFDNIIAVSEECKKAFIKKYPNLVSKVFVIENLTNPEFIHSLSLEQTNNELLRDNRFKLLTVARLSHQKGIDNAIRALKILKDKGYENLVWYVIGYGGEEETLKSIIKQSNLDDSFILLGKKINPYPYMNSCDLYVQPSRYEGKAVTVTEAKILNKPILITNYPTANSQVSHNIDGVICEMDPNEIARAIEELYQNPSQRESLKTHLSKNNYKNTHELKKLYRIMN
ncbi:MAG: glycosyltransferase [Bacilli bacterium]